MSLVGKGGHIFNLLLSILSTFMTFIIIIIFSDYESGPVVFAKHGQNCLHIIHCSFSLKRIFIMFRKPIKQLKILPFQTSLQLG